MNANGKSSAKISEAEESKINKAAEKIRNIVTKGIDAGASSFMAPEVTRTLEEAQQFVEDSHRSGGDRTVELAAAKEYRKSLHNEIKTRLLKDLDWRILNRGKVWKFTSIFFAIQNLIVFGIVGASFAFKPAFDLTTVFSIIIPVSLGTTAYAIKEVTKFLFNEVDYTQYLARIERIENAEIDDKPIE